MLLCDLIFHIELALHLEVVLTRRFIKDALICNDTSINSIQSKLVIELITYFKGIARGFCKNFVENKNPSMAMKRNCANVIIFPLPGCSLKMKFFV